MKRQMDRQKKRDKLVKNVDKLLEKDQSLIDLIEKITEPYHVIEHHDELAADVSKD